MTAHTPGNLIKPTPTRLRSGALALLITALAMFVPTTTAHASAPVSTIDTIRPDTEAFLLTAEANGSVLWRTLSGIGGESVIKRWVTGPATSDVFASVGCDDSDGLPPFSGQHCWNIALAADGMGNAYVRSWTDAKIHKIAPGGSVTTFAGGGAGGDGGPATGARILGDSGFAPLGGFGGFGMAMSASGDFFFTEGPKVRKVDTSGVITTVAGTGTEGFSGDGGPATAAQIGWANDVAVGSDGSVYIATEWVFPGGSDERVRRLDPSGKISTFAGTGPPGSLGDGGPANLAQLTRPMDVEVDAIGGVYITDEARLRYVDTTGTIDTIAGNGTNGYTGDGGPAQAAQISSIASIALDPDNGDVLLSNQAFYPNGLRRITRSGALAGTVTDAGTGLPTAGVVVTVMDTWPLWTAVASATTAADGTYHFDNLPAGRYRVRYFDPQGRYARRWHVGTSTYRAASTITLGPATERTADEALSPVGGLLQGTVTEDDGTPIPNVWVQVFDATGYVAGKATGPNGGYHLNGLPPGTYWLRFRAGPASSPRALWYPNSATFADATPITMGSTPVIANMTFPP